MEFTTTGRGQQKLLRNRHIYMSTEESCQKDPVCGIQYVFMDEKGNIPMHRVKQNAK